MKSILNTHLPLKTVQGSNVSVPSQVGDSVNLKTWALKSRESRAFTLVELLVVIVIVGVLFAVILMEYTGFSENARDTVRLSNISTIARLLGQSATKTGRYPTPDNPTSITWSGDTAWYQGTVGDNLAVAIKLSPKLKDPAYGVEYSYSITTNGKQYQIASIYKWDAKVWYFDDPVPATLAATVPNAMVRGTFNQVAVSATSSSDTARFIAVPSIILSDLSKTDLSAASFSTGSFVVEKQKNLPASYSGRIAPIAGNFYFVPKSIGTASGQLTSTDLTNYMEQAKLAYIGSSLLFDTDNQGTIWNTLVNTASGSSIQNTMAKGIFAGMTVGSK